MGQSIQTPLLEGQQQQQQPSAPPFTSGYPPIMSPGAMQHPAGYSGHAMGVPAPPAPVMTAPGMPIMHASAPYAPAAAPPAGYPVVVEQHLYLPDDPLISRVHAAPHPLTCPSCGNAGPTRVRRESGLCAYAACFAMCWLCCPLFWVPFCLDCDRDLVHRCGVCNTEVARVKPV